jgi:hypothetical protein
MATKGNPNWGRKEPIDWRFRVRGKNPKGEMVTLGNYREEKEARSRYDELVTEGYYRQLRIQPLKPKASESADA